MPSLAVRDNLEYFYIDSGAPNATEYKTIIIIHGHTFHSGTFKRLLPLAPSRSLRVIALNRREYPGTTPFSAEELRIFKSGSEEERAKLLAQQGFDLASFISTLVKQLDLPKDVTIVAWSMGNIFLMSLLSSINALPADVKGILQSSVKNIIMWDPPSQALGITSPPGGYVPLWDDDLPPEARGPAFGIWAASYWKHGDISTHDLKVFNYRDAEKYPAPSTENMGEELFSVTDFTAGDKCETVLVEPVFFGILSRQRDKALFDSATRDSWAGASFTHMYGDANSWNVIYSNWFLEDKVKTLNAGKGKELISFKLIPGANHFLMWDEPEAALNTFEAVIKS
ncbi:Alpha/Beta hydrolase protein [Gymnopilus junonius]|uniref:Alpha/Beta hydrolase protein n=1 Tax=Gymnopilus junonius TaxID=109634 RepID=A0A9P5NHG0_GYMJU|nr:Alpha/Beta hydrolase protein [Gymnopilus junonius]